MRGAAPAPPHVTGKGGPARTHHVPRGAWAYSFDLQGGVINAEAPHRCGAPDGGTVRYRYTVIVVASLPTLTSPVVSFTLTSMTLTRVPTAGWPKRLLYAVVMTAGEAAPPTNVVMSR